MQTVVTEYVILLLLLLLILLLVQKFTAIHYRITIADIIKKRGSTSKSVICGLTLRLFIQSALKWEVFPN